MSELYITTSLGAFAIAAGMPSRSSVKLPNPEEEKIEGLFRCFDELTQEFPVETFRKIFVEIGPGSFTGVRIGVTFARILSQYLKVPVVALKSLDILGAEESGVGMISPLIATGNGRVYTTVFENGKKTEREYAVDLDDWMDLFEDQKDKILFRGMLNPAVAGSVSENNFKYEDADIHKIIENMRLVAGDAKGRPPAARPYNEIVPFYLGLKEAEKSWDERMDEEMLKIKELKEEKRRLIADIAELDALKLEKEKQIKEMDKIASEKDSIRQKIQDAMEELSILNAKRLAYTESIAAKEKKIAGYEAKAETLKQTLVSMDSELSLRRANLERIKELPPEIPEEVELYIEQRDSLKREAENLKSEISNYSKQLDEMAGERFKDVLERIQKEETILENISALRKKKEEDIKGFSEIIEGLEKKRLDGEEKVKVLSERIGSLDALAKDASGVCEGNEIIKIESGEKAVPDGVLEEVPASESGKEPLIAGSEPSPDEEVEEATSAPQEIKALEKDETSFPGMLPTGELQKNEVAGLDYEIRPFRISDLPEVMAIEEASFERPWRRQMFKEELSIPVSKLFCLAGKWPGDDKKKVLGYAVFWNVSEKAHLINMAVGPSFRHKGIGKLLLYEVLMKAKSAGCKAAYLEVRVSSKYANELFQKSGFYKKGLRKDYFGYPKEDAVIYEREL